MLRSEVAGRSIVAFPGKVVNVCWGAVHSVDARFFRLWDFGETVVTCVGSDVTDARGPLG